MVEGDKHCLLWVLDYVLGHIRLYPICPGGESPLKEAWEGMQRELLLLRNRRQECR